LVSLALFHFYLLSTPFSLQGDAEPVHLMEGVVKEGRRVVWIVRQAEGRHLQLWRMDGRVHQVGIPEHTQYVVPHPDEDALFFVKRNKILKRSFQGEKWLDETLITCSLSVEPLPTWIPGFYCGSRLFLPSRDKVVIVADDQSGAFKEYPFKEHEASYGFNGSEYSFPHPITRGRSTYWTDNHDVYSLSPKIESHPFPSLGVMERAIPILRKPGFDWFVFGGERGDLDSFGWQIKGQETKGDGILTRFAQDPSGQQIFFTTISSRVSSHLYASMMGKKYFTLHVFEKRKGQWVRVQEEEFALKKGKGLFGIYWPGDWNGDGLIDMVVSDKSRGFRVFPGVLKRGFSLDSKSLGKPPEKILSLGEGFAWSEQKGGNWVLRFPGGGPL